MLFGSAHASSLAVFRILFGAMLLFDSINYGLFLCPDCTYRSSDLLFKYYYFEWVKLLPGAGLELVYLLMGVSALGVMLGLYYRVASVVVTVCFAYLFLLDQAQYLNHFYLAFLFASIMMFLPANTYWALDARRNSSIASDLIPNWGRFWLIAQLEIVLIYAGLVKINRDWLNLEPMRLWMNEKSEQSLAIFQWFTADWGIALASYGAIALHLIGAPLLLMRSTRLYALAAYAFFHVTNSLVFNIGIFPWMTLAATLMVFDSDWPLQFRRWVKTRGTNSSMATGAYEPYWNSSATTALIRKRFDVVLVAVLVCWLCVQVAVPLRHYFIPGDVAWNEGGHRFSWRMMLRSKRGSINFVVVQGSENITVNLSDHLNPKQMKTVTCLPDLIWQFAQFLETEYDDGSGADVKVYADAMCSLNHRKPAPLVNRLVDLTTIPRNHPVDEWLLPLDEPLPRAFF